MRGKKANESLEKGFANNLFIESFQILFTNFFFLLADKNYRREDNQNMFFLIVRKIFEEKEEAKYSAYTSLVV